MTELNPADPDHPLHHLGSRIVTSVPLYLEQLLPQLPPEHPWRERSRGQFQVVSNEPRISIAFDIVFASA